MKKLNIHAKICSWIIIIAFFSLTNSLAQTAAFSVNNTSQCMQGNSFAFSNQSTAGATAYKWDFGDGSSSTVANPVKAFTTSGNYNVQLIATYNGINYYASKTVAVNPEPQCGFTYLVATGTGNSYTFQSTSTIASGNMNYSWDFGDGTTGTTSNPTHTYANNGVYYVTLTVTSDMGCTCSSARYVLVTVSTSGGGTTSIFSFCIDNPHQCLSGNSFSFTNTSNWIAGTTFSWDFGDGTTSTANSPTKSYTAAGTYTVTLIATYGGISYTTKRTVTVDASPSVAISGTPCVGNILTATASGNIANLVWSVGGTATKTVVTTWNAVGTTVAGGNGAAPFVYPVTIGSSLNQLGGPRGIYLDEKKNLYVVDNFMGRLQMWAPGATSGVTVAYSTQITGVGVDCEGNIYVEDDADNVVKKWTPGATTGVIVAGGNGAGSGANQLHDPRGNLYIDKSGNIYINDTYNHRIQMWAPGATSGTTVAGGNGQGNAANQLNYPEGFFIDNFNNIYITDGGNHRIQKWALNATSGTTVAGGNGQGTAANQLYNPYSVYVDRAGNIYVDDVVPGGHRIQLWTPGATEGITILQPTASYPNYSIALAFVDTYNGDIYMSDETNNEVQKYSISGINLIDTANTAGTYTVTATSFAGCAVTSTGFSVYSLPIVPPIAGTPSFCIDNPPTLSDVTTGGSWGSTSPSVATIGSTGLISPVTAGIDTITYRVTNNGCSVSVSKQIVINPLPAINLTGGGACANLLTANVSGGTVSSLIWSLNGVALDTIYPTYNVNAATVAGGNGVGAAANQFNGNAGVALDSHGNLYVADTYNNRVQKFAPNSTIGVTVAGGNGTGNAANQLYNPQGIFIDKNDNLYVAENGNARVQKFTPGSTTGVTVAGGNGFGNNANQLSSVLPGLFVDTSGNVYVSDLANSRIQRWDAGATTGVTVAGGNGQGSAANQLINPYGIFVDANANVYVADQGNYRVQKWASNATAGITVAGGIAGPPDSAHLNGVTDVYVDATGAIYISDYFNRIMRWQAGAAYGTKLFGSNSVGGPGISELNTPYGFCIAPNGDIYVSDAGNGRVQKLTINSLADTLTPTTTGTYTVTATSFAGCSFTTSTSVTSFGVQPTINITAGGSCQTAICAGSSITFNAAITNGGTSPSIQWKVNGTNTATGSTFTSSSINNGDVITAELTSNAACPNPNPAISNAITMTVNASPTINVSGNCADSALIITSNTTLSTVTWSSGGTTLSTITPVWNTTGITVAGGLGSGQATNQFRSPTDVYVDTSGNIYVADLFNNRVQKFPPNSVSGTNGVTVAGQSDCTGGSGLDKLLNPHGFTLDDVGNVYVTNSAYNRVDEWAPNATFGKTVAGGNGQGSAANQLFVPRRIAIDKCGNLYIPDVYNHRVQKWALGATSGVTVAGGNGQGNAANQLNYPSDVALDAAGNIYVADADNNRIQKFPPNSTSATNGVTVAGTGVAGAALNQLDNAYGIYVDGAGNIIVADANNARIMYWATGASTGVLVAGGNGYGNASNQFNYPTNVTLDKYGNLYVTDEHNDRVQKFTLATGTFAPSTAGSYTINVVGNNGCAASQNVVIANCIAPSASFSINSTTQCSTNNNFTFSNTSIISGTVTYLWTFGDGTTSTATNPSHSYANAGIYTVTLKATVAGVDYISQQIITVNPNPIITLSGTGCNGSTLNVTSNGCTPSSLVWSSGSTIVSTANISYNQNATTVAGGNGQGSALNELFAPMQSFIDGAGNVYVADMINSRIMKWAPLATSGVVVAGGHGQGSALNQLNTPSGLFVDGSGAMYIADDINNRIVKWLPGASSGTVIAGGNGAGNASNQLSGPQTIKFDAAGNMYVVDFSNARIQKFMPGSTVGITVAGGNGIGSALNQFDSPFGMCLDTAGNIYVADAGNNRIIKWVPNATSGVVVIGGNGYGNATNQTNGPTDIYVDGNGNMYVADASNKRIQLWLKGASSGITIAGGNGTGNAANQFAYPYAFSLDGCGNLYVSDESNNRIQEFSSSIVTSFAVPSTGSYSVTATSLAGCSTTVSATACTPTSSFLVNNTEQCISSNSFVFSNTSNVPSGATYNWNFGDGNTSTATNPTHSYAAAGNFNVTLKVTSNGIDYYSNQSVILNPLPVASFTYNPNTGNGNSYTFNSTSTISSGNMSYSWDFGDGSSSSGISNPLHTYTSNGTYTVKLSVSGNGGCSSSDTQSIIVTNSNNGGSTPSVSFTDNGDMQCVNVNNYVFTNLSTAPSGTTYLWSFGDGSTSSSATTTHIYTIPGYYNVTLKATYNGIDYYNNHQVIVKPMPVASFVDYFNNSPNTYTLNSTSTVSSGSISTYFWNFGDGSTNNTPNPQHTFANAGSQTIKLVITSDGGCMDSITNPLVICPVMNNQAFSINAASSCLNGNYFGVQNYYGNNLNYPMTYLWDYGDGNTSTLQSPPWHTYSAAGNYNIKLYVTLSYPSCQVVTSTYAVPAIVSPMPVAAFNISGSPTTMCFTPTNNYNFNNTSSVASGYIMNYAWDFGDGTSSSSISTTKSYDTSGTYKVSLVVSTNMACSDTITKTIVLHPLPVATSLNIGSFTGTPDHPLDLNQTPSNYVHAMTLYDTIKCFNGYNWFFNTVSGSFTSVGDYWKVNFDDGSIGIGTSMGHGQPYKQYTTTGTHIVSGNIISNYGCISNTVYSRVILNPNSDTIPHAAIGLHATIINNACYDTYQLFVENLSTTACSPIINSYWSIEMIGGDVSYNHGTLWYNNNYYYTKPSAADMASVSFDVNPANLPTIKVTLITVNDVGMRDTAIAYFGHTNAGYSLFGTANHFVNNTPQIEIAPNPAHNLIGIGLFQPSSGTMNLQVFDAAGRLVISKKQVVSSNVYERLNMNISNLSAGVYVLKVTDSEGNAAPLKRFVKE